MANFKYEVRTQINDRNVEGISDKADKSYPEKVLIVFLNDALCFYY